MHFCTPYSLTRPVHTSFLRLYVQNAMQERQWMYNVTIRSVRTIVAVEKQWVLHNLNVCICSLRYPALCARAILSSVTCPAQRNVSTIFYKRHDVRKKLLNTKCVFWFSLHSLSESFLILKRNERGMTKICIALHVKYPLFLSDLNETSIFSTYFVNILRYQISWKSAEWELSFSKRTDRHDEANSCCLQYCESVLKNY
jgi:hypothetical protein